MGLLLTTLVAWLILGPFRELGGRHHGGIWIEPSQCNGPRTRHSTTTQVKAISQRVQNLNY